MSYIKELRIFNPDNLPIKRVLIWGDHVILLPDNAYVLWREDDGVGSGIPRILIKNEEYKYCTICHKLIKLVYFYNSSGRGDGKLTQCSACLAVKQKIYEDKHRFEKSVRDRKRYLKNKGFVV